MKYPTLFDDFTLINNKIKAATEPCFENITRSEISQYAEWVDKKTNENILSTGDRAIDSQAIQ